MSDHTEAKNVPVTRRSILNILPGVAGASIIGADTGRAVHNQHTENFEEREWGYVREDFESPESKQPVILLMNGYLGASSGEDLTSTAPPTHYVRMRDDALMALQLTDDELIPASGYWFAAASIRGTGCSGGRFKLFDRAHAHDGHELIEWLADRPWSMDGVGMFGASYSGITAFHVASTDPPSLAAMSASLVIGDLYRESTMPGGVPSPLFPALWTQGVRPAQDYLGTAIGISEQDSICAQNIAEREPESTASRLISEGTSYTNRTDGPSWRAKSLVTYVEDITIPTYVGHAWQDEQTGPRGGPILFEQLDPDSVRSHRDVPGNGPPLGAPGDTTNPKLLRATNGYHASGAAVAFADVNRWFDYWLLGEDTGIMDEPSVQLNLETVVGDEGQPEPNAVIGFDDFPIPEAEWTKFYLRNGGTLDNRQPDGDEPSDTYLTGSPRQSWIQPADSAGSEATLLEGPDVLTYRSATFDEPKVLAGPMAATLYIESTTTEMDLFVRIAAERSESDSAVPLQRGLLRASHRGIDESKTRYNDDGEIIRPYHPHLSPESIVPGEIYEYNVEIWPLGYLLRPGERILVRIHTPPLTDGLTGYEPSGEAGINRVYHDASRPSNVIVPLVDWPDQKPLPPMRPCGDAAGYRCVTYNPTDT